MKFLDWALLLFLVLSSFGVNGFDLKKWWGWIPIVSGFMFGVLFTFSESINLNLGGGICLGLGIALLTALTSVMMRRRRIEAKEQLNRFFQDREK